MGEKGDDAGKIQETWDPLLFLCKTAWATSGSDSLVVKWKSNTYLQAWLDFEDQITGSILWKAQPLSKPKSELWQRLGELFLWASPDPSSKRKTPTDSQPSSPAIMKRGKTPQPPCLLTRSTFMSPFYLPCSESLSNSANTNYQQAFTTCNILHCKLFYRFFSCVMGFYL